MNGDKTIIQTYDSWTWTSCLLHVQYYLESKFYYSVAGFDLMEYFNVRDILGTRVDEGQSSYVRLGTMPIVQQTE